MANTIGTGTYAGSARSKFASATMQQVLRKAQVAEAVCTVDRSDVRYIQNPYRGQAAASIHSGLVGTYSVSTFSVVDDVLTVGDEFVHAEHIYDFERWNNNFDLMAASIDEASYAIAYGIDWYVVNGLCEDATGTYSTAAGGLTTSSNVVKILADLCAKVAGYADLYKGMFLIVQNSDISGIIQAQAGLAFSFADSVVRNGFITSMLGVDIYVVRDNTFADPTATGGAVPSYSGSKTYLNSGHRVFGVKGTAWYAAPRGIQYEEKMVTGKTGREVVCYGYCGFKVWATKATLLVDITIN